MPSKKTGRSANPSVLSNLTLQNSTSNYLQNSAPDTTQNILKMVATQGLLSWNYSWYHIRNLTMHTSEANSPFPSQWGFCNTYQVGPLIQDYIVDHSSLLHTNFLLRSSSWIPGALKFWKPGRGVKHRSWTVALVLLQLLLKVLSPLPIITSITMILLPALSPSQGTTSHVFLPLGYLASSYQSTTHATK